MYWDNRSVAPPRDVRREGPRGQRATCCAARWCVGLIFILFFIFFLFLFLCSVPGLCAALGTPTESRSQVRIIRPTTTASSTVLHTTASVCTAPRPGSVRVTSRDAQVAVQKKLLETGTHKSTLQHVQLAQSGFVAAPRLGDDSDVPTEAAQRAATELLATTATDSNGMVLGPTESVINVALGVAHRTLSPTHAAVAGRSSSPMGHHQHQHQHQHHPHQAFRNEGPSPAPTPSPPTLRTQHDDSGGGGGGGGDGADGTDGVLGGDGGNPAALEGSGPTTSVHAARFLAIHGELPASLGQPGDEFLCEGDDFVVGGAPTGHRPTAPVPSPMTLQATASPRGFGRAGFPSPHATVASAYSSVYSFDENDYAYRAAARGSPVVTFEASREFKRLQDQFTLASKHAGYVTRRVGVHSGGDWRVCWRVPLADSFVCGVCCNAPSLRHHYHSHYHVHTHNITGHHRQTTVEFLCRLQKPKRKHASLVG